MQMELIEVVSERMKALLEAYEITRSTCSF